MSHRPRIRHILQRQDPKHQHRRLDHLRPELRVRRHERLRIRTKDPRRGLLRRRHGPDPYTTFVRVDGVVVVPIDDTRGEEPGERLCEQVDGEAPPGETPIQTVAECYCGVEVSTAVARDVDA